MLFFQCLLFKKVRSTFLPSHFLYFSSLFFLSSLSSLHTILQLSIGRLQFAIMAFVKTRHDISWPDLQLHFSNGLLAEGMKQIFGNSVQLLKEADWGYLLLSLLVSPPLLLLVIICSYCYALLLVPLLGVLFD
jgi:hypothetical protein